MNNHIPDAGKMACPNCGAPVATKEDGSPCRNHDGSWVAFECLTSIHADHNARACQSIPCEENERANKMPPDGFYSALVRRDTGGEMLKAVEVHKGKVLQPNGVEIRPEACSGFVPIGTWDYCRTWPVLASCELETLRTANAALVEQSKTLSRERDHANDTASAVLKENAALAVEVERLQAWKDSWLDIESKWDASAIAVMLGGKAGESTRAVIAREVPRLVERMKQLESAANGGAM